MNNATRKALPMGFCLFKGKRLRRRAPQPNSFHVTFSSKKRSPTAHCQWLPETIRFLHFLQNHGLSRPSTAVLILYVRHLPSAPFHTGLKAALFYTCALYRKSSRENHSPWVVFDHQPVPFHPRPPPFSSSISNQLDCGFLCLFTVSLHIRSVPLLVAEGHVES